MKVALQLNMESSKCKIGTPLHGTFRGFAITNDINCFNSEEENNLISTKLTLMNKKSVSFIEENRHICEKTKRNHSVIIPLHFMSIDKYE